jgi:pimeloyl-ACP methyl ester carboxylesterase
LSGRLVFLPCGRRRAGYYLDSASDYQKVKALVAIYAVASALFQLLGSTSSLVITLGASFDRPGPLAGKLEFALIIYIISAFTFQWLPMLLLWRLYRALLPELCSSLQEVDPESMGNLQTIPNPMRRRGLIVAFAGLLVMLGPFLGLPPSVHGHISNADTYAALKRDRQQFTSGFGGCTIKIAGSKLVILPTSGHMIFIDQPGMFEKAVEESLGK